MPKTNPPTPGPRLFNVDRRTCLDPAQPWAPVAHNITSAEAGRIIANGIELPEITPHVYRAYNIYDNPGP